jgi:PAS domain S-box-containing protein
MVWRDQAELYRNDDLQVMESGDAKLLIEEPQTTLEGKTVTLLTSKIPLRSSEGEVIGVLGTYMDITDRKQAEQLLRETEEKYRTLFESSRDAIMTLAPPTWLFTSGNPATVQLFRVSDEAEFISLGPWQLSPERQLDGKPSAEKAVEMIETAMRNGSHFFEWTHCHSDGTPFPAEVLLTRMEQGDQVLLQATVRDITERKRIEEEREKLIRELQNALAEVKTLSGLLPICAHCKNVRDDKGYWNKIESYIHQHSGTQFSHGICPECAKKFYSDFDLYNDSE